MKKHAIQIIVISLALLLTACADSGASFIGWGFLLLVGGYLVWVVAKGVAEGMQMEDARSHAQSALKRQLVSKQDGMSGNSTSVMPSDMLIDVNANSGIAVDTRHQQVAILRGRFSRPTIISYRDVLSSEIIEDGETVTKTSRGGGQIGGALLGGLVLGGAGAIVGGLVGSTISPEKISKIVLMITINDVENPVHDVMLLDDDNGCGKSSHAYKDAMGKAQKWHSKIKVLIHQADHEDRRQEKETAAKTVAIVPQESLTDQLEKLGDLRDRGILTEAEFASQKAKLLSSG